MRVNSLAFRLILSAAGVMVVILLVTGIALSTINRQSVERAFDRRLGVFLNVLVADVASPEENAEKFPQSIGGEPLFELPLSGWYWQVTRLDKEKPEVRSSRSLWDANLPHLADTDATSDGSVRSGYIQGPEDQRLRLIERQIDLGEDGRYLISVAGDTAEIDSDTGSFDRALATTFCVLGVVLLLITLFQVRFGLAPLVRISASLAGIRSGAAERLEGTFPDEIAPLARETNALIDANREIVQRARMHVGNLAHALKTPLSVIVNEAAARRDDPFATKVLEQTDVMRDQVTRHLDRARLAAGLAVVVNVTDVRPVVDALARTMPKIYSDRAIAIDVEVPQDARFRGERQDLEEMVGNLVDNACKWARSRVTIAGSRERVDGAHGDQVVRHVIDDDGPGLPAAQRAQIAVPRRGQRLDETKPGSGLGLSIVVELAALYGGQLSLDTAPLGGLRAELVLPAA